ncbi:hypothetical protein BOO91_11490 [Vibrio navarrensis]|nr:MULTISPECIES: hypothetical protein [Vibrio]KJR29737.1 hypothetical protein UF06_10370 [Vibrio sp. S234-5]MBE3653599.1 hypothetical protein [Vibrio navarrensis]MBE3657225.1 hypothetical protein [Vibrio navarrensis]MBE3661548.1 hypothetical protein [Vibrio navarrensis]MBE3670294.1 hypothetical protein [Vibrio navarrensis]
MNTDEHDFFNLLSDIILLKFSTLTAWEKNFISELHHKAVTKLPISSKQKQCALKIFTKSKKAKIAKFPIRT